MTSGNLKIVFQTGKKSVDNSFNISSQNHAFDITSINNWKPFFLESENYEKVHLALLFFGEYNLYIVN